MNQQHLYSIGSYLQQDTPAFSVDPPPTQSGCSDSCPSRRALQRVLVETIEALEQTRRSFKSRQIETLRKKLTRILLETP